VGSNDESLEMYGRQAINLIHFCCPSPSKELVYGGVPPLKVVSSIFPFQEPKNCIR
jgi:hypothetical protein